MDELLALVLTPKPEALARPKRSRSKPASENGHEAAEDKPRRSRSRKPVAPVAVPPPA
jgi:hypothetical protein